MCHLIKIPIMLTIFFQLISCKFPINKKFNIPADVRQFQYSPTQKLLAIATDSYLLLLDGVTTALIQNITFPQLFKFNCLAFSHDESKIAIGYKMGNTTEITSFSISTNQIQNQLPQQNENHNTTHPLNFNYSTRFFVYQPIGQITSICFFKSNDYFIFGTSQGRMMMWKSSSQKYVAQFTGDFITINSLSCSPANDYQLIVAGENSISNQSATLILYRMNTQSHQLNIIHKFNVTKQNISINSVTYSKKGNIFFVGTNKTIYKIQRSELNIIETLLPVLVYTLTKIRVSEHENIIGICDNATMFCILEEVIKNQQSTQYEEHIVKGIEHKLAGPQNQYLIYTLLSMHPTFALSPTGVSVAYPKQETRGDIASQCIEGEYIQNRLHKCTSCAAKCLLCLDADYCFQCSLAYYKSHNYTCQKCLNHCLVCSNGSICQKCYETFTMSKDGVCHCEKGRFIKDLICEKCIEKCEQCTNGLKCQKCFEGFQFSNGRCIPQDNKYKIWIVILSIILVLTIVTAVLGVIAFRIKRGNKKKRQLLSDSDDGERIPI